MRHFSGIAVLAVFASAPAFAAPSFSGTWKADLSTATTPQKPLTFSVDKGSYSCTTCVPARDLPADGAFHPVKNHPFIDEESVKVVDEHTLEISYKHHGKDSGSDTLAVSTDGKTLSDHNVSISESGVKATASVDLTRIAPASAGAHGASGSWKQGKVASADDNALKMTITDTGKTFGASFPTGESFTATVNGPAVPLKNDSSGIKITVKRKSPTLVVVTSAVGGKAYDYQTMTLAADGKTISSTDHDLRHGETTTVKLTKQ